VSASALVLGGLLSLAPGMVEPPLSVPPGFRVGVFASGLNAPRFMTLDPSGTLLVSIPNEGRVVALPDRTGDGTADDVVTVARDLDLPHGLAFRGGDLYVAETGRILRFRYDPARLRASGAVVVVARLPSREHHWTRTIVFGGDGRLYVAVGSSCNICRETDPRRAAVIRYEADGTREHLFAGGLRSVVGLAVHPRTGALWATVNERDWRGDAAPPDYVTELRDGAHYGWPDCFVSGGAATPDPERAGGRACAGVALPTLEIPPHSVPLGLAFYTGRRFPAAYHGRLFVAYHGSRTGLPPSGYKVVTVTPRPGQPPRVEDFVTGWRRDTRVRGRPVDLLVGADGALYVSDDHAGVIHRVSFQR
jgi:glucose/arabinose dehydrogenase